MSDSKHSLRGTDETGSGGDELNRRDFLGMLGAAAITSAFLGGMPARADDGTVWYYDSFGNVIPANPDAIAAGVYPPPLPPGVQPPEEPDAAGDRDRKGRRLGLEDDPGGGGSPDTFNPPNILLIMVDQMRQERWFPAAGEGAIFGPSGVLGNLTLLRNNSFVFGNHFTAATKCSPARATLLTGLYSQQTCMFAPVNTPQGAAPAPPTLQTTYNTIGTALSSLGYACTWIGKWHLSAYGDAGSSTVGYNGPSDYGFGESSLDIPNLSAGSPVNDYPLDNTYPSPDGLMNEGVGGRDLHDESIASGYRAISPQTFAAPPYYQLRDGAIADAFVNYFLATANLPTSPWFTAVSFVNPHDMSNFPYAYGLTTGNFSAPTGSPLTTGYDAPPTAGWDSSGDNDYVPPLSTVSPYGTSAPSDFQGVPWNYQNATITGDPVDDPISLPYATLQANGQYGKPGLQAYQENQLNVASGSVNNEAGWITFLNYYYWMQACVDAQIGRVIGALQANNALWQTTDIIFTSDHGEYAGSHNLHAKGAGLYDEAMNVPLFVSYPPQRMGTGGYGAGNPIFINDFLTSSVDILPFLYTLAAGNEDWRSESGNLIYYLRHRESIADAIYAERTGGTPAQRRVVNITVGENTVTLPYILHTFDEDTTASIPGSGGTSQPSHAIGFRTFAYNGPSAYAGGGKLGIYSYWPSSTTECSSGQSATSPYITSETPQQFEFYDYTNGSPPNYGEVGNQALVEAGSSPVLTAEAAAYLAAFESIQNSELYNFFSEFYSSYTAAYDTYLAFAGLTGWCYTPPSGGA